MPDYKKKKINRLKGAPKQKKAKRVTPPENDDIVMTPTPAKSRSRPPKTEKPVSNMRVVNGKKLERKKRVRVSLSAVSAAAVVFTAIDHKKFSALSMVCYILLGWLIIFVLKPAVETIGVAGFLWLLAGGVSYTVGAALYGAGHKKPLLHTVFHCFVVLGSALQSVCILWFVL